MGNKVKTSAPLEPRFSRSLMPITDYYSIDEILGEGSFATVRKGSDKASGVGVAIKIISKKGLSYKPESLNNEIQILQKLKHPYVIQCYDLFETENEVFLVMELMTGGTLYERIEKKEKYREKDAKQVMTKLFYAIEYFHSIGIVHRDLKPENLLMVSRSNDIKIKVSDFGLSRIFQFSSDSERMKTAAGTIAYVAPEVLENIEGYNREVDLWSAGVIMYVMLSGYHPFYSENEAEIIEMIRLADFVYDSPDWDNITEEAKDLIDNLLVVDPSARMTVHQALNHDWFKTDKSKSKKNKGK